MAAPTIPEKIGQFYLGSETYPTQDTPVLYDAADLTTHAIIIGMTGSGKTGLGVCLLEEAALDGIPAIVIDPKGDMGNLALNFPTLHAQDFSPWIDKTTLAPSGEKNIGEIQSIADKWRKGIEESGQSSERMQMLKDANVVRIFTPGSEVGLQISLLADLSPPDESIKNSAEHYADYLDATASALLALLGEKAGILDPIHVFLVHILKSYWESGKSLSLTDLIGAISNPPFTQIGVLPTEQVFPAKSRSALALSLNNLLASPSFAAWRNGQQLDCENLFFDASKKPQTSVLTISHLSDSERMFFVTLLLNNLVGWMRRQQGSTTLRAILYMDELMGFLPPNGNPSSKRLLLTLLKQARAFGLGIVLSTQNPVDLDYKALSNAGTWFIGRLQTAQDRARVTEGLLSASGKGIARTELNDWFDRLGKRQFLLHNIHEETPCIFHTRWAMSYLAGPLTPAQISQLTASEKASTPILTSATEQQDDSSPAILPACIASYYFPIENFSGTAQYFPVVIGSARLFFTDKKSNLRHEQSLLLCCPFWGDTVDWSKAQPAGIEVEALQKSAYNPATYHPAPPTVAQEESWKKWQSDFKTYLRKNQTITLFSCDIVNQYSRPGEDEMTFRNRIALKLREKRDAEMITLRQKYATRQVALNRQVLTAEGTVARENAQSSQSLLDVGLSLGSTLLSAFTGRKILSQENIRRSAGVLRKVGKIGKERQGLSIAHEKLDLAQQQLSAMQTQLQEDIDKLQARYDAQTIELTQTTIDLASSGVDIRFVALAYRTLR